MLAVDHGDAPCRHRDHTAGSGNTSDPGDVQAGHHHAGHHERGPERDDHGGDDAGDKADGDSA